MTQDAAANSSWVANDDSPPFHASMTAHPSAAGTRPSHSAVRRLQSPRVHAPVTFPGDLILLAYLLGLGRFFTASAALKTRP